ncbi:MAG TPA: hypothetical protein VLK25_10845 [Allosphingosinicella sp.]|nr:hypothetical protein [Allosphingosinicella sp.]
MKRMIVIGLALVIIVTVATGLLSLAWRGPAPILTAYHKARGLRPTNDVDTRINDDPCVQLEVSESGNDAVLSERSVWDRDCIGPYPAQVMHGVWYDGFEESGFVPNVSSVPLYRVIGQDSVNPEFDTELHMEVHEARRRIRIRPDEYAPETVAIAITFVGRRTRPYRTPYGRQYQRIVVDAVLSGRVIGPVMTCVNLPDHESECEDPH